MFSEEKARRLLQAMNEQQARGRTDVDVFPAAVAEEVGIVADTNTFYAAVGHLEAEGYIDPSPNATLVGRESSGSRRRAWPGWKLLGRRSELWCSEGTSQSVANTLIDWVIHRRAWKGSSANYFRL